MITLLSEFRSATNGYELTFHRAFDYLLEQETSLEKLIENKFDRILCSGSKINSEKGLKNLNLDLAGKTGTTNENTDTWFIGFTSKLLVGVYFGHDNPKSLGKRETGAKTAMPIFKNFIKNSTKKKDARPFKVANDVVMMVVDSETGEKASFGTKKTIIEVFKKKDINKQDLIKSKINNRLKNNNVLRFY